ncbi:hypothetical protein ACIBF5_29005 [Micromonospora sp. NPDC050417]|uniref:hypothetical protein n=1 Tax=Micromonospora sp. NPDC050417 TaxID=3364280 RepID=UPI00379655C9
MRALTERPEYRAVYAGTETDIPGNRLLVHRKPSEAFDAAVRTLVPAERLWLRDVPYSAVDLEAGLTRVRGDMTYWQNRGIAISTISTQPGLGCVQIGLPNLDRGRAALVEHYKPNTPVCVVFELPPIPMPMPAR